MVCMRTAYGGGRRGHCDIGSRLPRCPRPLYRQIPTQKLGFLSLLGSMLRWIEERTPVEGVPDAVRTEIGLGDRRWPPASERGCTAATE